MQGVQAPTGATQAKDRLYTQLAGSFGRMNRALLQTSNLCELLQMDLHAMRTFVGLDAATFMTVAASLNPDPGQPEQSQTDPHTTTEHGEELNRS
ncbi:hypothetical protein BDP27DRAFT_1310497 [Rhodocollybia butyracea]|uniref:Uncharacterized protein n=1 Tax=Rhodocollybia butyracea TaxID=206335 RepID=A0A9P5Q9S2_9AGAR|nr:hypothetical protein BDP27DRAFT_1310497 [Rhodocollybia butyracea]